MVHPEFGPLAFVVVRRRIGDDREDAIDLRVRRRDGEEGAAKFCQVRLCDVGPILLGVWR